MATKRKADCTPEEWAAILERNRAYCATRDPEKRREAYKRYMEKLRANPELMEKHRARQKRYRENNREKINATKRRCRQRNPEHYRAYYRKWHALNAASKAPEPGSGLAELRAKVRTETIYAQIWALLPDKMSVEWREDIASEAMVLMLAGDCDDPAEAVKLGRTNLNRATSSYGMISLDAEVTEGLRMIDMIADNAPRAGYAA
ncbi:hypothetical protein BDD41_2320 [Paracoccus versutus]|uniref:Uncharacterized protein n=2 Tax=Paracoccus versutus TaxID=34007 RepID=A0A3D9XGK6_PARVE|nr:hypothetical protein BDD41_2320 [Paracoccus versutus]